MAAELGQQTVEFSTLVSRAAEESFLSLKELVEKSRASDQSDNEKKINILKYLNKTQQRMLRLNVLAKWCQQVCPLNLHFFLFWPRWVSGFWHLNRIGIVKLRVFDDFRGLGNGNLGVLWVGTCEFRLVDWKNVYVVTGTLGGQDWLCGLIGWS